MIIQDHSISHHHVALGVGSDVLLMRHHDDCDATLIQLLKNCHDLDTGAAVEIAGRLIGKQQFRIVDQRARDRDPLLLATGELARMMIFAAVETN